MTLETYDPTKDRMYMFHMKMYDVGPNDEVTDLGSDHFLLQTGFKIPHHFFHTDSRYVDEATKNFMSKTLKSLREQIEKKKPQENS